MNICFYSFVDNFLEFAEFTIVVAIRSIGIRMELELIFRSNPHPFFLSFRPKRDSLHAEPNYPRASPCKISSKEKSSNSPWSAST